MPEATATTFRLTREERKRIFAGDSTAIRRKERPDIEPGAQIVLSWTRGGRHIVDRENGATIDLPRIPTLWIHITERRRQEGEWLVRFRIEDRREAERFVHRAPSGRRAVGLKTRLRPKEEVPRREAPESFTSETERGYAATGRGAVDELSAVPDWWLQKDRVRREVDTANSGKQLVQRKREEKMRKEGELAAAKRRGSRRAVIDLGHDVRRLGKELRDLGQEVEEDAA